MVGLRQLGEEGGDLRVLVDLGLPAAGDRRRQVRAADHRGGRSEPFGDLGRARLQLVRLLGEEVRSGFDLALDPRRHPRQSGDLGRANQHVGDRRARRRKQAWQADHGDARLPRFLDQSASGAGDDPARAKRLGRGKAGQRLLGIA